MSQKLVEMEMGMILREWEEMRTGTQL